jgi:hypothetical protein
MAVEFVFSPSGKAIRLVGFSKKMDLKRAKKWKTTKNVR